MDKIFFNFTLNAKFKKTKKFGVGGIFSIVSSKSCDILNIYVKLVGPNSKEKLSKRSKFHIVLSRTISERNKLCWH